MLSFDDFVPPGQIHPEFCNRFNAAEHDYQGEVDRIRAQFRPKYEALDSLNLPEEEHMERLYKLSLQEQNLLIEPLVYFQLRMAKIAEEAERNGFSGK